MNVLEAATEILNAETLQAAETAAANPGGIIGSVESLIGLADRGITLFGQAIELIEKVQTMAAMKRQGQEPEPQQQPIYDVYPMQPQQVIAAPPAPASQPPTPAPEPKQPIKVHTGSKMDIKIDEETLTTVVIPIGKMILEKYPEITIDELFSMAREGLTALDTKTQLIHSKTLQECLEFAEKEPEMLLRVVNFFGA